MHKITLMLIIFFSGVLTCNVIEAELLMLDDFKDGKINDSFWRKAGGVEAAWKVDKFQDDNRLEVHRTKGDGSGPDEYGFGLVKFKDFGIQLDFYLLEDPFPPRIEILFRANPDMFFYQLIINPVNGAGKENTARWYRLKVQIPERRKSTLSTVLSCLFRLRPMPGIPFLYWGKDLILNSTSKGRRMRVQKRFMPGRISRTSIRKGSWVFIPTEN